VRFEVKLADGRVVEMTDDDAENACRRAADLYGSAAVAWRHPRFEIVPGVDPRQIIG
jgi:hypothetical protein